MSFNRHIRAALKDLKFTRKNSQKYRFSINLLFLILCWFYCVMKYCGSTVMFKNISTNKTLEFIVDFSTCMKIR